MIIHAVRNGTLTKQERLELASLLVKAGYSVRLGKAKIDGKSVEFVEFGETAPFHTIERIERQNLEAALRAAGRAVEDAGPYKEDEHGASE